jgi:hypothetical protein
MRYSKPQILTENKPEEVIHGSTTKQQHNIADNNPFLPECTVPAYEVDE